MIKKTFRELRKSERDYPGIIKNIRLFEDAVLPACPNCGSNHTATVIAGIIGRTICMVGSTTRIRLHPNQPFEGSYYCNDCTAYYEADGRFCFRKIPQPEPRPAETGSPSKPAESNPDQPQPVFVSLEKKEGETRQQRNERVAADFLLALRLQEADRQCVENLRAAGHTEEEIEELGRLY